MDLFASAAERRPEGKPLAERMRPRTLEEVVGQESILGPGTWLRRAVDSRRLGSIILWGPPGVGKTTIGRLLAGASGARFVPLSAVMAGVKDVREAVAEAIERRNVRGQSTVLFIDEIHRFNKSQQDALLPHVENGAIILVGATTENPSFEVNAPLLSRAKVLVLKALGPEALRALIDRALEDKERGLGGRLLDCADDIRDQIAHEAAGDARRALNLLESAAAVPEEQPGVRGIIDRVAVEQALQHKAILYDKGGDEHYAVVSAFIKSMRGSDPDAAVYWLARMLEAGEDLMFVARRIVIFAAEDVGNADPAALGIALAAMEATRFVGMPEAYLPLTQATTYLACAPKSNASMTAFLSARAAVQEHGALPVPTHLRNASSSLATALGHGRNYKYPHDHPGHHVNEVYLPEIIAGRRFFTPSEEGEEKALGARLQRLRTRSK
jgi:putative ATPase